MLDKKWILGTCVSMVYFTVAPVGTDSTEWVYWKGFYYYTSHSAPNSTKLSQAEASRYCSQHGGFLLSLISQSESQFIIAELEGNLKSTYVWIGLEPTTFRLHGCDLCDDCTLQTNNNRTTTTHNCEACRKCRINWKWSDSRPLTYVKWDPYQPNENLPCVSMEYPSALWFDSQCQKARHFVCKRAPCPRRCFTSKCRDINRRCVRADSASTTVKYKELNANQDTSSSSGNVQTLTYTLAAVFLSLIVVLSVIFCVMLRRTRFLNRYRNQNCDITRKRHVLNTCHHHGDNNIISDTSCHEEMLSSTCDNDEFCESGSVVDFDLADDDVDIENSMDDGSVTSHATTSDDSRWNDQTLFRNPKELTKVTGDRRYCELIKERGVKSLSCDDVTMFRSDVTRLSDVIRTCGDVSVSCDDAIETCDDFTRNFSIHH